MRPLACAAAEQPNPPCAGARVPPPDRAPGRRKPERSRRLARRPGCPSSLAYLHGPLLSSSGNSDALASITTAPFRANRTTPPGGFGADRAVPAGRGRALAGWLALSAHLLGPTDTNSVPANAFNASQPRRTGASGRGDAELPAARRHPAGLRLFFCVVMKLARPPATRRPAAAPW